MKRFLLLMSLLPCLVIAQGKSERNIDLKGWVKNLHRKSALRSDQVVRLDSVYHYQGRPGRLDMIARHTYDEQGRLAEAVREHPSGDETYPSSFTKIVYDYLEGIAEPAVEAYYSLEEGVWEPTSRHETDFNAAGKLQETRLFYYDEGEWRLNDKTVATDFDEQGVYTVVIDSIFEDEVPQVIKMEVLFKDNYTVADTKFYYWEEEISTWRHVQSNQFAFDDNQNPLHDVATENYEGEGWRPYYEIVYTYDERNNQIGEEECNWDGYDTPYYFYQRMQNFYSDRLVTANKGLTNATIQIRLEHNMQLLTIALGDATIGQLSVVNPAGKTILQKTLNRQQQTLSVQALPAGVYFIRVDTPQGSKTEKYFLP